MKKNSEYLYTEKKKPKWLRVCEWIILFPIIATIWLVKNKDIPKAVKIPIIAVIWVLTLLVYAGAAASGENTVAEETETEAQAVIPDIVVSTDEKVAEVETADRAIPEETVIETVEEPTTEAAPEPTPEPEVQEIVPVENNDTTVTKEAPAEEPQIDEQALLAAQQEALLAQQAAEQQALLEQQQALLAQQAAEQQAAAMVTAPVHGQGRSVSLAPGSLVWLSATGSKFHSINNCGKMVPENARQVTIDSAVSQGFEACENCW